MESKTTIHQMLVGNKIFVPNHHKAYSWEAPQENCKSKTQTEVFLLDLVNYNNGSSMTPFHFGSFQFEKRSENNFYVMDGQQRLTTIVIFLSVLFSKLKALRVLTESEEFLYEDTIKRKSTYRFETIDYDNQAFKDYVIDQIKKDKYGIETESAGRIVNAFDFFSNALEGKCETFLTNMLKTVCHASCTTLTIERQSGSNPDIAKLYNKSSNLSCIYLEINYIRFNLNISISH